MPWPRASRAACEWPCAPAARAELLQRDQGGWLPLPSAGSAATLHRGEIRAPRSGRLLVPDTPITSLQVRRSLRASMQQGSNDHSTDCRWSSSSTQSQPPQRHAAKAAAAAAAAAAARVSFAFPSQQRFRLSFGSPSDGTSNSTDTFVIRFSHQFSVVLILNAHFVLSQVAFARLSPFFAHVQLVINAVCESTEC